MIKPNILEEKIMLDAITPLGSTGLLVKQIKEVILEYLKLPNQTCLTEDHKGCSIELRQLASQARGQAYKLTISLQEVYGYPKSNK